MILEKNIPQTIILVMALFFFSCSTNNGKTSERTISPTSDQNGQEHTPIQSENITAPTELSLDYFKGIPDDIDGCSCYFSETDQKFKNEEYLFAAGFDSTGFVSVNKKLVKLKLVSTEREPNTFGDHDNIDIYNSELYNVIIDIKHEKASGDEVWWNNGTVTIKTKDGEKVIKNFVGECGC